MPIGSGPRPASGPEEQPSSGLHANVMVHIARDGQTTIVCHRSEMGQGVRSTIPLLIADELGADPARVRVRQADGDAKYGDQNTDGSSSIRKFYADLRRAGAAVRVMLIAAAAQRWHVKPESCTAKNHEVVHLPSKRALPFSELVDAAAKLPVPKQESLVLRPESELVHVNDPDLPVLDGLAIVTGSAVFGADVNLPDLLIAVIARPPAVGSKWLHYDAARALAVPGVKRVVEMPAPKLPQFARLIDCGMVFSSRQTEESPGCVPGVLELSRILGRPGLGRQANPHTPVPSGRRHQVISRFSTTP